MKNKIELFKNAIYNIFATIVPVIFLQIIVYPLLSRKLILNDYGQMLTLIGLGTMIIQVSGIGVNNTRIIMNKEYTNEQKGEDFNLIALLIVILNFFSTIIILIICNIPILSLETGLFIIFVELGFFNLYINSQFSIEMNYKKILVSNIFLILGYSLGILCYYLTDMWILVFICGITLSVIFGIKNTNFWKNGFKKSKLFSISLNKTIIISISSFMISLITYADRVFLYPLLGAEMVAVYYTASQFGKLIGMGLSPISNVLLSFFSTSDTFKVRDFWKVNLVNFIFCGVFYIISLFLSKPVIEFLYPTISNESLRYMNLANLGALIMASSSLVQPFILKFCSAKWQIYIQLSHIAVYFILGYYCVTNWGLLGFCYSNIIASIFRLLFMCTVGSISMTKQGVKGN